MLIRAMTFSKPLAGLAQLEATSPRNSCHEHLLWLPTARRGWPGQARPRGLWVAERARRRQASRKLKCRKRTHGNHSVPVHPGRDYALAALARRADARA